MGKTNAFSGVEFYGAGGKGVAAESQATRFSNGPASGHGIKGSLNALLQLYEIIFTLLLRALSTSHFTLEDREFEIPLRGKETDNP